MRVYMDGKIGVSLPDSTDETSYLDPISDSVFRVQKETSYSLAASGFRRPAMSLTPRT